VKVLLSFFLLATLLFAEDFYEDCESYVASLPHKEARRVVMQSFETIIDLYRSSNLLQKQDFLAHLDDFEIELFLEYLRKNYPDEFDQLH